MLGRTGVAHYARRCSWAHSEGHIGVAHYGILVGGPLQLRWQPIGRRCLWAHLGEVPTESNPFRVIPLLGDSSPCRRILFSGTWGT